jgi:hypothetical protein
MFPGQDPEPLPGLGDFLGMAGHGGHRVFGFEGLIEHLPADPPERRR